MSTMVTAIDVMTGRIPFRFTFGHALAARRSTHNVFVRATLSDGSAGFGEGVPREYVTGEALDDVAHSLESRFGPALLGVELASPQSVVDTLDTLADGDPALAGAARCALELALMDAAGHHFHQGAAEWISPVRTSVVAYDAVIPFAGPHKTEAMGIAIRALGINRIKVKVGRTLDDDLATLRRVRRMVGAGADIRVDANCAWTAEQALHAIDRMRPFNISVVEQPVAAGDIEGLRRLRTECRESIAVDESLRTPGDARALIEAGACDAFNIRVSKCGGLIESKRIATLARAAGLFCIVGAQVGESGILSAAGRHLAASIRPRYLEGSAGRLLLDRDITRENVMPGWRGRARAFTGDGLGVHVDEARLHEYCRTERSLRLLAQPVNGGAPR